MIPLTPAMTTNSAFRVQKKNGQETGICRSFQRKRNLKQYYWEKQNKTKNNQKCLHVYSMPAMGGRAVKRRKLWLKKKKSEKTCIRQ